MNRPPRSSVTRPARPTKIELDAAATGTWEKSDIVIGQLTGERGPAPGGADCRREKGEDRRKQRVWAFIYGCFHPRRRAHRREQDDHHWHTDWHDSGLLYLALAIVLMSCMDALFTLNLLAVGGEELNLFMKFMIEDNVDRFLMTKIGLTSAGVVVLVAASRYKMLGIVPVRRMLQLICAGYCVLIAHELILLTPLIQQSL